MATAAILGRAEGRVQPQDLEAETSVLGSILLDQAAITRVLDFLSPEDFYRENNAQIYRAALNLFREGEPIDNVTLASELEKLGVLERIGGRAHLALIQEAVPTAANVEHYARIVKDKAYKRRLITAGGQVTALGFDDSIDADEAVNQAQAHVYAISDDRTGSGMERLYDLLKPAMDRIDAQMASGGAVIGIPSGFHDVDRITNGFKHSDLIVVAGRPSMGKALALDTPIPTPRGWTTMGDLQVGDQVFDEQGFPCTVTFATPVQEARECYEVLFSDGERIVADADHQWSVLAMEGHPGRGDGHSVVLTTRQMLGSLRTEDGRRWNYSIAIARPLRYPQADLPHDPYLVGRECMRIPRCYQQAAVDQRMALLQGLMDTAGSIDQIGRAEFCSTEKALAEGAHELATGLGLAPRLTTDRATLSGGVHRCEYRMRFHANGAPLFHQPKPRVHPKSPDLVRREVGARRSAPWDWAEVGQRFVTSIIPVDSVPVRCIRVDSPSHLYLAGRACVPTHNTSFALNVALHAAVDHKKPVAIFSLEMSKEQLVERMLCEQARIDAQRLHRGTLSDVEYERLAGALGPLGDAPIFIDDAPALDDLTMRLKARQARSREGIELIVLDYLQLMHSRAGSPDTNRVQEVSAISRALKSIARELRIPVIAISQLSRAPEARPDRRPVLSDLRESGCMPASTRLLRADNNQEVTLGDLVLSQQKPLVWSLDENWRLVPRRLLRAFPSGVKPVFRLRLASGYEVDATANHAFRDLDGWRRLDELSVGRFIAVPRRLPGPALPGRDRCDENDLVLLAHLLADDSVGRGTEYATADDANAQAVIDAARRPSGVEVQGERSGRTWQLWLPSPIRLTHRCRNPVSDWLDRLGLSEKRAHDRFIPEALHSLPQDQIALFLRHLWATDGSITLSRNGKGLVARIYYASTSKVLVEGVRRLLLRLDIRSHVKRTPKDGYRDRWHLDVTGAKDMTHFLTVVGGHGKQGDVVPNSVDALADQTPNPNVEKMAAIVNSQSLAASATSDVCWDEVVDISPLGELPTFDATVDGTHNFVANGVVAHNSIEQDSDLVMFLYRDEYYNRDRTEKPGIAEVLIAKHRNGPTGMVELVFRKELTRFENLERRRPEGAGPDA